MQYCYGELWVESWQPASQEITLTALHAGAAGFDPLACTETAAGDIIAKMPTEGHLARIERDTRASVQ